MTASRDPPVGNRNDLAVAARLIEVPLGKLPIEQLVDDTGDIRRSTLLMVLSIFFFGGETLHHFSLALAIGICFGIYSSALVMASLVMWLGGSREDLVKPERRQGMAGEKILP